MFFRFAANLHSPHQGIRDADSSTQALRALDSFARHGSVWRAAEELHLTRSAVSHQLRLLERDLGFDLLERGGQGRALTRARARRYANQVRKALTVIRRRRGPARRPAASAACCTRELHARLRLAVGCAPISPISRTSIPTCRCASSRRAGSTTSATPRSTSSWPSATATGRTVRSKLLCEVEFTPLCSPVLLNKIGGLAEPAGVLAAPLLHLGDFEDWTRWLTLDRGRRIPTPGAGIVFSDMNLVFAAATAGQGIAMGDELTCRIGHARRSARAPLRHRRSSRPRSYFLVAEHAKAGHPALRAFADWLSLARWPRPTPRWLRACDRGRPAHALGSLR